eukprot:4977-Heterococcus_DN1.PRE.1
MQQCTHMQSVGSCAVHTSCYVAKGMLLAVSERSSCAYRRKNLVIYQSLPLSVHRCLGLQCKCCCALLAKTPLPPSQPVQSVFTRHRAKLTNKYEFITWLLYADTNRRQK